LYSFLHTERNFQ